MMGLGAAIAYLLGTSSLFVTAAVLSVHASLGPSEAAGEALVKKNDCLSCHAIDQPVVGPAFNAIAKRYAGQTGAVAKLVAKVRSGGSGDWGTTAMTPHPNVSNADLTTMVEWILSLRSSTASAGASAKRYTYTLGDGKKVTLDFPLFETDHNVTPAVFSGWERFDSYCFRCHGEDAVGGELAPDLRESLQNGMTKQQFIATAMAGRPGKGMPSWAGFFSLNEITEIYEYVKGRSVGLVPAGRPDSQ